MKKRERLQSVEHLKYVNPTRLVVAAEKAYDWKKVMRRDEFKKFYFILHESLPNYRPKYCMLERHKVKPLLYVGHNKEKILKGTFREVGFHKARGLISGGTKNIGIATMEDEPLVFIKYPREDLEKYPPTLTYEDFSGANYYNVYWDPDFKRKELFPKLIYPGITVTPVPGCHMHIYREYKKQLRAELPHIKQKGYIYGRLGEMQILHDRMVKFL